MTDNSVSPRSSTPVECDISTQTSSEFGIASSSTENTEDTPSVTIVDDSCAIGRATVATTSSIAIGSGGTCMLGWSITSLQPTFDSRGLLEWNDEHNMAHIQTFQRQWIYKINEFMFQVNNSGTDVAIHMQNTNQEILLFTMFKQINDRLDNIEHRLKILEFLPPKVGGPEYQKATANFANMVDKLN